MKLGQRRQAMLQLHLSDQQFNCLLRCTLYKRLDGSTSIRINPMSWHMTLDVSPDIHPHMEPAPKALTHWGRVTYICVSKLTIIGSDNGLSPERRQAIILTNAGILLIGPLGTNFSEILIAIETFSFKKMHLKISSAKWRPFCLGLNVLKHLKSQAIRPLVQHPVQSSNKQKHQSSILLALCVGNPYHQPCQHATHHGQS